MALALAVAMLGAMSALSMAQAAAQSNQAPNTDIDYSTPAPAPGVPITFSGTATDDVSPERVLLVIYNEARQTWNGTEFTSTYTRVDAQNLNPAGQHQAKGWAYTFTVAEAGRYVVGARAYDGEGAYDRSPDWLVLRVDGAAPNTTADPIPSSVLGEAVTLTGTATDDWGVREVRLVIYNPENHTWNGSAFTPEYTRVNAELIGEGRSVEWSYTLTSPDTGRHVVGARALDMAWKWHARGAWRAFQVTEPVASRNIHIDCGAASNEPADGSSSAPYRSVQEVIDEEGSLVPADANWVLFKRGTLCLDSASIVIDRDGARIGAYGVAGGPRPSISSTISILDGESYPAMVYVDAVDVEIHELELSLQSTNSDPVVDFTGEACVAGAGSSGTVNDYIGGIYVNRFASDVKINYVSVSGFWAGIQLVGDGNEVTDSTIFENTMMTGLLSSNDNDDAGAFGVLINGSDNLVKNNNFWGHVTCSSDYVLDGSAVEVFARQVENNNGVVLWTTAGSNNRIEANRSLQQSVRRPDHHFSELGTNDFDDPSIEMVGNQFLSNTYVNTQDAICANPADPSDCTTGVFIVTRGAGDFGPVKSTSIVGNTTTLTGTLSKGVVCHNCDADTVTNIYSLQAANPAMCARELIVQASDLGIAIPGRAC